MFDFIKKYKERRLQKKEQKAFEKFRMQYSIYYQFEFTQREYENLWQFVKQCNGNIDKAEDMMTELDLWDKHTILTLDETYRLLNRYDEDVLKMKYLSGDRWAK